jgi:membrane protein
LRSARIRAMVAGKEPLMPRLWSLAKGTIWRLSHARLGLIAAGVAFYAMFAIFPGMTATLAIFSLAADPSAVQDYMTVAERFIPPEAYDVLEAQIFSLVSGPRTTLGWATGLSLGVALVSARAGVAAMMLGLDIIHGSGSRGGVRAFLTGIVITLALVGVMLASLAVVVVAPLLVAFLHMEAFQGWLHSWLPWGLMGLIVLSALFILYRFGPEWGPSQATVAPGALVATILWAGASLAFTAYLANFDSYNRVYGSIGAVAALLMWLYLSVYAVLAGAAVNAEVADSSARSRQT